MKEWQRAERKAEELLTVSNPEWQDDGTSKGCTGCAKEFSMFRRRHHCRTCGKLYCHDCSPNTCKVAGHKDPQRVCLECQGIIERAAEEPAEYVSVAPDLTTFVDLHRASSPGVDSRPPSRPISPPPEITDP